MVSRYFFMRNSEEPKSSTYVLSCGIVEYIKPKVSGPCRGIAEEKRINIFEHHNFRRI